MTTRLWYLTRYHFWPLIDDAGDSGRLVTFPARAPLFGEADPSERALILKSGHVRIRKELTELGVQTVEVVNPGEVVGVTRSDLPASSPESAETMDPVEAYAFTQAELAERAAIRPLPPSTATARSLLHIHRIEVPMDQMLFQPIETRLARTLRLLAERYPDSRDPSGRAIALKLPAWMLADLVESNRELVLLTLGEWLRGGILARTRGRLVIRDPDALQRAAAGA